MDKEKENMETEKDTTEKETTVKATMESDIILGPKVTMPLPCGSLCAAPNIKYG